MPFESSMSPDSNDATLERKLAEVRAEMSDEGFAPTQEFILTLRPIANLLNNADRTELLNRIPAGKDGWAALQEAANVLYPSKAELVSNLINDGAYSRDRWQHVDTDLHDTAMRVLAPTHGIGRDEHERRAA